MVANAGDQTFKEQAIDVGKYTFKTAKERDLPGMAQQIAYNVLFALGPLLIFVTALAGFLTQTINSDAENPVAPISDWMTENLPSEAAQFLQEPIENALTTSPGFMLSFGAIFALWGARNAIAILMKGLNLAMGVEEERSWVKQQLTAIALTIGGAVTLAIASLLYVLGTDLGQDLADAVNLGSVWSTVLVWLRWPVIAVAIILGVAMLHRFAPDYQAPLRAYLPGAIVTVVLWVVALVGLRLYFLVAGGYAEAYGVFGAVLAFVFWLYVMSLVALLGGVVNGAVQHEVPEVRGDEYEEAIAD
jgi:membrane protein